MRRIVQKKFEEKLNYLLKQKLRYNGELITLTIHVTMLTYLILILLYILRKILQMGYHWWYIPNQRTQAMLEHINVLGLKATKIEIYTYCKNIHFLHVKVMVWQCHICQVNNMGDIKSQTCNNIVCRIWDFMLNTNSGSHIYTRNNQYWGR